MCTLLSVDELAQQKVFTNLSEALDSPDTVYALQLIKPAEELSKIWALKELNYLGLMFLDQMPDLHTDQLPCLSSLLLSNIPADEVSFKILESNTHLNKLTLEGLQKQSFELNFNVFQKLEQLFLESNQLSKSPDLSGLAALQRLNLSNNQLTVLHFEALPPQLAHLDASKNSIEKLQQIIPPQLVGLRLSNNQIKDLHLEVPEGNQIKNISLENNPIQSLSFGTTTFECLAQLFISNSTDTSHIDQLSIPLMPQLQHLVLSNLGIQQIQLDKLPKLKKLDLSYNPINSLDLGNTIDLQEINLMGTNISSTQIADLQKSHPNAVIHS